MLQNKKNTKKSWIGRKQIKDASLKKQANFFWFTVIQRVTMDEICKSSSDEVVNDV